MVPTKRLLTSADLKLWSNSDTKAKLFQFITTLSESVVGHENEQYQEPLSPAIMAIDALLDKVSIIIEKYPVDSKEASISRFGKVQFRDFYADLKSSADEMLKSTFPSLNDSCIENLATYFCESWGNCQRIDYGSGHELNFMCFFYGLYSYEAVNIKQDATNLVLKIFNKYLKIMRLLEQKYWLEPAGSHGVWGLDDYHFLPFLFGAHQLSTHKRLKPISIHNEEIVEMFADKYLYFGCISFINSVKTTASLRWHSPMLDDISGVKKWSKVAEGMLKMYNAEVFEKLPIMQHFYFCDFLQCPEGVTPYNPDNNTAIEEHVHSTWGDCCGIKVPSAIAANEMSKTHRKPLPFD